MDLLRFDRCLCPGTDDAASTSYPVETRLFETAFSAPAGSCPIWPIAVLSTAPCWSQPSSNLGAVSGFSIAGRLSEGLQRQLGNKRRAFSTHTGVLPMPWGIDECGSRMSSSGNPKGSLALPDRPNLPHDTNVGSPDRGFLSGETQLCSTKLSWAS